MFPIRDTQPSYSKPIVTVSIIVLNLVVFLYEFSLDPFSQNAFMNHYALIPDRFRFANVITSMFLHGGWMHVLGNMWFLWVFGDNIEDILGHAKYLAFYLLCGISAAFTQVFFDPFSRVPMVGASGAIAGVMGAYMVKFPQSRIRTLVFIVVFITMADIPAWVMLVYWFFLQFVGGFESLSTQQMMQGGTAFFAHVGGFLSGIALIYLLRPEMRYTRRRDLYW
ncbi:MAG TPA: rhomboid family intramembrane serine protease [Bryobacteraceae bacterium]|nr:rhomboid family intramembrane serine protease [Bryobacteraceae bacterium]